MGAIGVVDPSFELGVGWTYSTGAYRYGPDPTAAHTGNYCAQLTSAKPGATWIHGSITTPLNMLHDNYLETSVYLFRSSIAGSGGIALDLFDGETLLRTVPGIVPLDEWWQWKIVKSFRIVGSDPWIRLIAYQDTIGEWFVDDVTITLVAPDTYFVPENGTGPISFRSWVIDDIMGSLVRRDKAIRDESGNIRSRDDLGKRDRDDVLRTLEPIIERSFEEL